MKFKYLILATMLILCSSLSKASEHKVLNFIEFYKTTLSDTEQYLKSQKCKYNITEEENKGYRKYKKIHISKCFNLPMEQKSVISLIYLNTLKDFSIDEVTVIYKNTNNTFKQYQDSLIKKYGKLKDTNNNNWKAKLYNINHFKLKGFGLIYYSGIADSSIGDFNYDLFDNNNLLGFIELNKTTLEEVKIKLNELNCYYNESKETTLGVKTKDIIIPRCFFLPKLDAVHISSLDKESSSNNYVDEVVFTYDYDTRNHESYLKQLKLRYGNNYFTSPMDTQWINKIYKIVVSKPLKLDTVLKKTTAEVLFVTNDRNKTFLESTSKKFKEMENLNNL